MSGGARTKCINEKGGFFASGCFGAVFTLLAQFHFRCAEVLLQPKAFEPPGGTSALWARNASVARKCCSSRRPTSRQAGHQHCGREMLPLRGSVAPAEDLRAAGRDVSTVGAKCFRCAEVLLQPKTYEPPGGTLALWARNASVARKCPSSRRPTSSQTEISVLWARNASVARKCCSSRRPAPRRRYQCCGRELLPLRGSVASVRGLPAPRRRYQHFGRELLPLRGSVAPVEDLPAPRRRYQCCGREVLPLRGSVASVRGDPRSVRNGTRE